MLAKIIQATSLCWLLTNLAVADSRLVLSMADQPGDRPAVVTALDLSPDGKQIVAGGDDHCLRLWNATTGERVATLHGHKDWVHAARFTPTGDQIASVGADHSVHLWLKDGSQAQHSVLSAEGPLSAVAIHPQGNRLATVGFGDALRLFDLETFNEPTKYGCACQDTRAVAFSPDGRWLAAAGRNGTVRLWDLVASGGPRDLPGDGRRIRTLAFSPSGNVLATGGDGPAVRLWSLEASSEFGAPLPEAPEELITRPGKTYSLAFVNDRLLAVGGTADTIQLWNTRQRSPAETLSGHTGTVAAMAASADGKVLVSGAFDATVRVWDLSESIALRTAAQEQANQATR